MPEIETEVATKRCTSCGERKPLAEFYRHKGRPDGHQTRCKPCDREASRIWHEANPERHAENMKAWEAANPEKVSTYARRSRRRYPDREKARTAVRNAVREGKLSKPSQCEDCGEHFENPRKLDSHHDDYSKPLEVRWLCRGCHVRRHRA